MFGKVDVMEVMEVMDVMLLLAAGREIDAYKRKDNKMMGNKEWYSIRSHAGAKSETLPQVIWEKEWASNKLPSDWPRQREYGIMSHGRTLASGKK